MFAAAALVLFNLPLIGVWHRQLCRPNVPADEIVFDDAFDIGVARSRVYPLEFSRYGQYEIGLRFSNRAQVLSAFGSGGPEYRFGGKLRISVLSGNRVLSSNLVDSALVYRHAKDDLGRYREMVLEVIPLPYRGRFSQLKLSVQVLEPDLVLSQSGGAALYVGESRVP